MWYYVEKMLFSRKKRKQRRSQFLQKLLRPLVKELGIRNSELRALCNKISDYQSFRYWNADLVVKPFLEGITYISFIRISYLKKKYEVTFFRPGDIVGETYTVLF